MGSWKVKSETWKWERRIVEVNSKNVKVPQNTSNEVGK